MQNTANKNDRAMAILGLGLIFLALFILSCCMGNIKSPQTRREQLEGFAPQGYPVLLVEVEKV